MSEHRVGRRFSTRLRGGIRYLGATMSDDKNFLARWARRKRDAAPDTREQPKPEKADGGAAPRHSAASLSPGETQPLFDPASLPPIESIVAGSDISAFLAAAVPADVARAALRCVWSSDPMIRDFVGLSENAWDFNAPGAMPGFGPIEKEEVARLVTRLLGEPDATAAAAHRTTSPTQADKPEAYASEPAPAGEIQAIPGSEGPVSTPKQLDTLTATNDVAHRDGAAPASQHEPGVADHRKMAARFGRGSALPR
jgi:hypothetical protein